MLSVEKLHDHKPIIINNIELKKVDVNNNIPHTHDFWEIGFIEEGNGLHTIDFIEMPITNCTVYFLKKGVVHQLYRAAGSHGKVILFKDDILTDAKLKQQLLLTTCQIQLPKNIFLQLKELFAQLEYYIDNFNLQQAYLQLVLNFYLQYAGIHYVNSEKIHEFIYYVEQHHNAKLTVEECAHHLNLSYQQLLTEVQKKLNATPLQIIINRTILEAKRQLYNTTESVKTIAYNLNFEDSSYFCKYFKNHVGCSPQEFRKQKI
jgi:AraC family transcriptional regulator, transcriptional activator of pobA